MSIAKSAKFKPLLVVFFILGVSLLLVGIYGMVGSVILPESIISSFQEKNCDRVLQLFGYYSRFYFDGNGEKAGVSKQVSECALYRLASRQEEQKAWQDAYNAYKIYIEIYPTGTFLNQAREHNAQVLLAWARDLVVQKKSGDAVAKLDLVMRSYAGTAASQEVPGLMLKIYSESVTELRSVRDFAGAKAVLNQFQDWSEKNNQVEAIKAAEGMVAQLDLGWGGALRSTKDFGGAERIFNQLQNWAQSHQQMDVSKVASQELAQTYLEWANDLKSQQKFAEAQSRLEQAIATDLDTQSSNGPASQARSVIPALHIDWGNFILTQNDYAGAFSQFKIALELSDSKDKALVKDATVRAYLKWADSLTKAEDFLQALEKIKLAENDPGTDASKKEVETARADTYKAFSNSSGEQAHAAMKKALRTICEENKKPEMPIFGLDENNVQVGVFGLDIVLPENVAATTPGALHYVACMQQATILVGVINYQFVSIGYQRMDWAITLWDMNTATVKTETIIKGGQPQSVDSAGIGSAKTIQNPNNVSFFHGSLPEISDLANWLLTVMK